MPATRITVDEFEWMIATALLTEPDDRDPRVEVAVVPGLAVAIEDLL